MTRIAAMPLLPAAMATVGLALLAGAAPLAALPTAGVLALAAAALGAMSADRMRRLAWAGAAIAAAGMAVRILVPPPSAPDLAAFADLRSTLGQPLRRLVPEPESGILLGIALGDRAGIAADLAYAFSRSGTTHLLAISGFNMTLVATAVGAVLRGRAGPLVRSIATVTAVVLYSLLVGLGASVVRSAIMAGTASLGLALGRRAAAANGLCAAIAAMLLLEPAILDDPGFLLSAAATGGLLAFQAPLAARLRALPPVLGEGLATTLAATVPTLPIIAGIFGRISLVSPIANVVAVPLFPFLMVAGVSTVTAGVLSTDAARPFALVAYVLARVLRAVVETSAAIPAAALDVPRGPVTAVALSAGCAAIAIVARRVGLPPAPWPRWPAALPRPPVPSRRVVALTLAATVAIAAVAAALAGGTPAFRVRALDIGQGDAFLVETGGRLALIDGGPDPNRLLAELGATLPAWQRRIDLVVLTHAHVDHGAGLIAVLDRYDVGLAVAPRGLNAGPLADAWAGGIARRGIARADVGAGSTVRLGAARIRVLAPNADPLVDVPSLVLRFEIGGASILFSGDATEAAQADLLLEPASLRSRIYVPPHHGAATPYAKALASAVRPEIAIISAGLDNRYGHPTAETLAALDGVPIYRTDRDGTIEVSIDGPRLVVRPHANGLPPPRPQGIPRLSSPGR
jgi:competence protein ComEC